MNQRVDAIEIIEGDAITLPGAGMVMVREVKPILATDGDMNRMDHVQLRVALGRTDDGFYVTLPGFFPIDVYRETRTPA